MTQHGYSPAQFSLHWIIAALIAFQLILPDGILLAYQEYFTPEVLETEPTATDYLLADLHTYVGITILLLAMIRVWLRMTRGVPPLPEDEPTMMKLAARVVHAALYAAIFLMPITGILAWYFGIELAREYHGRIENAIYIILVLHVVGSLYQHFMAKTDVLRRMLWPSSN